MEPGSDGGGDARDVIKVGGGLDYKDRAGRGGDGGDGGDGAGCRCGCMYACSLHSLADCRIDSGTPVAGEGFELVTERVGVGSAVHGEVFVEKAGELADVVGKARVGLVEIFKKGPQELQRSFGQFLRGRIVVRLTRVGD